MQTLLSQKLQSFFVHHGVRITGETIPISRVKVAGYLQQCLNRQHAIGGEQSEKAADRAIFNFCMESSPLPILKEGLQVIKFRFVQMCRYYNHQPKDLLVPSNLPEELYERYFLLIWLWKIPCYKKVADSEINELLVFVDTAILRRDAPNAYLYIDWNTLSYIKKIYIEQIAQEDWAKFLPSTVSVETMSEFYGHLETSKQLIPYSIAHLLDLNNSAQLGNDRLEQDLDFLQNFSKGYILEDDHEKPWPKLIPDIREEFFKAKTYLDEPPVNILLSEFDFMVDMEKLDKKSIFYNYLLEENGHFNPAVFFKVLDEMQTHFQNDEPNAYVLLRDNVEALRQVKRGNILVDLDPLLQETFSKFIKFLHCKDIEDLPKLLKEVASLLPRLVNPTQCWENMCLRDQIVQCYDLLDFHQEYKEKAKHVRKKKPSNMTHDALHLWFACKSQYLISEDVPARNKAKAVTTALQLSMTVVSIADFIQLKKCLK